MRNKKAREIRKVAKYFFDKNEKFLTSTETTLKKLERKFKQEYKKESK